MNVAALCGSLADFLIARTLRLGSYPTRKAMERDTGMGSHQGPCGLDQTSTSDDDEQGKPPISIRSAVPILVLALAAVASGGGRGPASWYLLGGPTHLSCCEKAQQAGPEAWGRVPFAGKMDRRGASIGLPGQTGSTAGSFGCHVLRSHHCFMSPRMASLMLAHVGVGLSVPGLAVVGPGKSLVGCPVGPEPQKVQLSSRGFCHRHVW